MIAVRIFKKLHAPIAELPELDGLVGRRIEMIVFEACEAEEPISAPPLHASPAPANVEPALLRRRVRVCGVVTGVSDSGDAFHLKVDPAADIPCTWAGEDASAVIGAGGRKMVIAGTGVFTATGVLLRIDVRAASPALPTDARFSRIPHFADEEPVELGTTTLITEELPGKSAAALAAPPVEAPRPALSAATSFTAIFGKPVDD